MARRAPKADRPPRAELEGDAYDRILAVARRLFGQHGFNETSVRDITSAAEVNLSAVTYYFDTKELLYHRVLRSIVFPLAVRVEGVAASKTTAPLERIERVVEAFFLHFGENPDMPAFVMRELASGRAPSGPVLMMQQRVRAAVSGIIEEGQKKGEIRAGDPTLMTFSVIAQPVHLYLARHAIAAVTGLDLGNPGTMQRILDHVKLAVRRTLEAR